MVEILLERNVFLVIDDFCGQCLLRQNHILPGIVTIFSFAHGYVINPVNWTRFDTFIVIVVMWIANTVEI